MTDSPIVYLAGAEPFFHRGGPVGVVLLHGFTATPAEPRWLGQHLAGKGYTVLIPRSTGHGMQPEDLARMRWQDWYASALDAYHILRQTCDTVVVGGHSGGGALALLLASDQPVAGVFALASPLCFDHNPMMARARWLKYVLPYSDRSDRSTLPQIVREEQARRGEPVRGRVRYDRWPLAGIDQLYQLAGVASERLDRITAPILTMYSTGDKTVPLTSRDRVMERVRSAEQTHLLLEQSGHILPQDVEREAVFEGVTNFIERYTSRA